MALKYIDLDDPETLEQVAAEPPTHRLVCRVCAEQDSERAEPAFFWQGRLPAEADASSQAILEHLAQDHPGLAVPEVDVRLVRG